mmetsp:Transcript_24344/g.69144  ORF Transcript_24344/g.69144 Transcript_24344/m.69144 type:complete len:383 (-) Transcript_24344:80-1228(-)
MASAMEVCYPFCRGALFGTPWDRSFVKDRIAKEYTEYSADELAQLMAGGGEQEEAGPPTASSDDFLAAARFEGEAGLAPGWPCKDPAAFPWQEVSEVARAVQGEASAPLCMALCKELTEYSSRELSVLLADTSAEVSRQLSSDDFIEEPRLVGGTPFFSWYHQQCMVPTSASVKRTRRVYHNRRKTAWTDFDEDDDAQGKQQQQLQKKKSHESGEQPPVSETRSAIVELLKSRSCPTQEEVREVAFQEATLPGGGFDGAVVLKRTGACGWTPLLVAVQRRQLAAVKALLLLGADADDRESASGWTPLMYAAGAGNVDMVRLLLSHGASVNAVAPKQSWSPLCSAIQSGKSELVRLLLEAGADLQAVKKQHPAIAEALAQGLC